MGMWLHELRERLLRAGVAPRHVRRYLIELREHWADLTWVLGTGRPVVDKTGLAGRYDFTIQRPVLLPSPQQGGISAPDPGPSAASIADQLGLKLEPSKGRVETLVIDHVERPSLN